MQRDTTNVGPEMYVYTGNDLSHRNINKRFREYLEAITGKHSVDSLQNAAVLGTSHQHGKYCSLELEAWTLGITVGSGELSGRKGL